MTERTINDHVTFENSFRIAGDLLPAGRYRTVADEVMIPGLSFEAWHRTALHIVVDRPGCTDLRSITQASLDAALALDRAQSINTGGEAAPSPLEDVP